VTAAPELIEKFRSTQSVGDKVCTGDVSPNAVPASTRTSTPPTSRAGI